MCTQTWWGRYFRRQSVQGKWKLKKISKIAAIQALYTEFSFKLLVERLILELFRNIIFSWKWLSKKSIKLSVRFPSPAQFVHGSGNPTARFEYAWKRGKIGIPAERLLHSFRPSAVNSTSGSWCAWAALTYIQLRTSERQDKSGEGAFADAWSNFCFFSLLMRIADSQKVEEEFTAFKAEIQQRSAFVLELGKSLVVLARC